MTPSTRAKDKLRGILGSLGEVGTRAASMMRKVIGAQSGGDARFFQFFQQSFVERTIAVQIALQDAVFDRALVEFVRFLFLLFKRGAQHIFALQGGQVLSLEVIDGLVGFRLQLAVDLLSVGC
jgi:hypothetical protein